MGLNSNDKIHQYIDHICSKVKNSKVHSEIKEEVTGHIEEICEEYISEGFSQEEAITKAISHMGDSSLIGEELNKIHKESPDWILLALTLAFTSLGLLMLYFIESKGLLRNTSFSFFSISFVSSVVGIVIVISLYYFDYKKLQKYSKHIYFITLILMLVPIFTESPVSRKAWINLGIPINFIDITPVIFTIALASLLRNIRWRETKSAIQGLLMIIMPILLMYACLSFYPIVLYSVSIIVILALTDIKKRYITLLAILSIGAGILYFYSQPYRAARLFAFLNAHKDPLGDGYMNVQLERLIHTAGLWGRGFTLEAKMLPEVHTDFIFTYIIYTFGWVSGILLAALVILFLLRVSRIASIVKDNYAKQLISGFVAIYFMQFLWNLLMNLGLAPIMEIGLPFISYGNSQFILNMIVIGLMSNIYKQRNVCMASKEVAQVE